MMFKSASLEHTGCRFVPRNLWIIDSKTSPKILNPRMTKSRVENDLIFAYPIIHILLILKVICINTCYAVLFRVRNDKKEVYTSAKHMQFFFFFSPNIFRPQMVESADSEPLAMEG